jgi:hypothetical protein
MQSPCCLCVCESSTPINFWMPEPVFMKIYMHIMAPEPITKAYFINPSHQSLCLYVYPTFVARQRLGKQFPTATNTFSDRRNVGRVIFYADRVLWKESRWLVLPWSSCSQLRSSPAQILCACSRWAPTGLKTSDLKSASSEDHWIWSNLIAGASVPFMDQRNQSRFCCYFQKKRDRTKGWTDLGSYVISSLPRAEFSGPPSRVALQGQQLWVERGVFLTSVNVKVTVFCNATEYNAVRRFEGTFCFHIHDTGHNNNVTCILIRRQ